MHKSFTTIPAKHSRPTVAVSLKKSFARRTDTQKYTSAPKTARIDAKLDVAKKMPPKTILVMSEAACEGIRTLDF